MQPAEVTVNYYGGAGGATYTGLELAVLCRFSGMAADSVEVTVSKQVDG